MASSPSESPDAGSGTPRHVVGIGGSAGSLAALQALLGAMPADTGMAFVIVPHHPSGKRSLLPEILTEWTALPVKLAEEGEILRPNQVYVALSDGEWGISGGRLVGAETETAQLADRRGRGGVPHPVDSFFRSLGAEMGRRAIGIVLSGTGTDGTVGCKAIKSQAGMLMAQQPDSAEFKGMPASAITTNLVDYVLPPEDMPPALVAYAEAEQRRASEGHPDTEISEDETPAAYCPLCDRPFDTEHALALHLGELHESDLDDEERADYEEARDEERDELWLFHAKVVAALGSIYAVTVILYLVAIQSGFL